MSPSRTLAGIGVSCLAAARAAEYPRGVPYPAPIPVEPGTTHQIDVVGPRHLFGAARFHALNLIHVGSYLARNDIVTELVPPAL